MDLTLTYGLENFTITVPSETKIIRPSLGKPLSDTYIAIIKQLLQPIGYKRTLFDMAKSCQSACIVVDAMIPPQIIDLLLKPIVKTLHASGLNHRDVFFLLVAEYPTILTDSDIPDLMPEKIIQNYRIETHTPFDSTEHEFVGKTSHGIEVYFDRRFNNSNMKIITSLVLPNPLTWIECASVLLTNAMINENTLRQLVDLFERQEFSEQSKKNQVIFNEILQIQEFAKLDFIINVMINSRMQLTNIFGGSALKANRMTIKTIQNKYTTVVKKPVDIVITTAGGVHFDHYWYQNLKTLYLAHSLLKTNGWVFFYTHFFDHYTQNDLAKIKTLEDLTNLPDIHRVPHTVVNKLISSFDQTKIVFISEKLKQVIVDIESRHVSFSPSVKDALQLVKNRKKQPSIAVLPDGPFSFFRI